MIELPDVERMIDTISGYTTGKTISSVLIDDPDVVELDLGVAEDHLEEKAIESVERHGRYVVLRFRSDYHFSRISSHISDCEKFIAFFSTSTKFIAS